MVSPPGSPSNGAAKYAGSEGADPDGEWTPLDERLLTDEIKARVEALKDELRDEIRRRLVDDRGAEAMARTLQKPLLEDVEFMHATSAEMRALRQAILPLTRKLAARLAQKRKHLRTGRLDIRRTIRNSLASGGVPLEPKFRHPRPSRPEVFLVCDISGSVASFARFTMQLMYAMSEQFSKIRSFVFIDGLDEVTDVFDKATDMPEALQRVTTEAKVVWVDGHSDYGHAFDVFRTGWGETVSKKTTMIFTGDARNNYHAPQASIIKELAARARRTYWLNPEPKSYWDTGDSIVSEYARYCTGVRVPQPAPAREVRVTTSCERCPAHRDMVRSRLHPRSCARRPCRVGHQSQRCRVAARMAGLAVVAGGIAAGCCHDRRRLAAVRKLDEAEHDPAWVDVDEAAGLFLACAGQPGWWCSSDSPSSASRTS